MIALLEGPTSFVLTFLLLTLATVLSLPLWSRRRVLGACALAAIGALVTHALWAWAPTWEMRRQAEAAATFSIVLLVAATLGLVVSAAGRGAQRVIAPGLAMKRRDFLAAAAAVAPITTTASAATAVATAGRPPVELTRVLRLASLPPALEGLRILQISDVHLGFQRSVADVERFVDGMLENGTRFDLLAITGDVADDTAQLAPALKELLRLSPRLGTYACPGNHEHYGDMQLVRRTFERAGIPLLEGRGVRVGKLWVAGVDDPVVIHGQLAIGHAEELRPYYDGAIARALEGKPDDAFPLLLCHRPEGFDAARALGARVVLSGHTHGGHLGWRGKSLVERAAPGLRAWGTYGDDQARLHVTSGFGHWFQLRAGCPAEAPIVELRSA